MGFFMQVAWRKVLLLRQKALGIITQLVECAIELAFRYRLLVPTVMVVLR